MVSKLQISSKSPPQETRGVNLTTSTIGTDTKAKSMLKESLTLSTKASKWSIKGSLSKSKPRGKVSRRGSDRFLMPLMTIIQRTLGRRTGMQKETIPLKAESQGSIRKIMEKYIL